MTIPRTKRIRKCLIPSISVVVDLEDKINTKFYAKLAEQLAISLKSLKLIKALAWKIQNISNIDINVSFMIQIMKLLRRFYTMSKLSLHFLMVDFEPKDDLLGILAHGLIKSKNLNTLSMIFSESRYLGMVYKNAFFSSITENLVNFRLEIGNSITNKNHREDFIKKLPKFKNLKRLKISFDEDRYIEINDIYRIFQAASKISLESLNTDFDGCTRVIISNDFENLFKELKKNHLLRELSLNFSGSNNSISDKSFSSLAMILKTLKNLEKLEISCYEGKHQLTDKGMEHLANAIYYLDKFNNLSIFAGDGNNFITNQSIHLFNQHNLFKKLIKFELSIDAGKNAITNDGLIELATGIETANLEEILLNFSNSQDHKISDRGFIFLSKSLRNSKNLKKIDIRLIDSDVSISTKGLKEFATTLRQLSHLTDLCFGLCGSKKIKITDAGLIPLFESLKFLPELEQFSVDFVDTSLNVTNKSLIAFAKKLQFLPFLTKIILSFPGKGIKINNEGVEFLASKLCYLKRIKSFMLNLDNDSKKIEEKTVLTLVKKALKLNRLWNLNFGFSGTHYDLQNDCMVKISRYLKSINRVCNVSVIYEY